MKRNLPRKEISNNGATFKIAGLTMAQVKKFAANQKDAKDAAPPDTDNAFQIRSYELVCDGLNNALDDGDPIWTATRIDDEVDLVTFDILTREILALSGLKATEDNKTPGEALAPSPA